VGFPRRELPKRDMEIIRKACLPGSPLLSFGGSRTQHRIACAIEDAGWGIRDTLMWVYGSGFPKSESISTALDKQECRKRLIEKLGRNPSQEEFRAEWAKFREIVGKAAGMGKQNPEWNGTAKGRKENSFKPEYDATKPSTPEAQLWEGYGTALKPAYEPIILAMNPLDGTFANNALKYKVAGLNIDETRIGTDNHIVHGKEAGTFQPCGGETIKDYHEVKGRFPANFLHDGSQIVMELFPLSKGQQGDIKGTEPSAPAKNTYGEYGRHSFGKRGDNGSAARFFYCAKA